MNLSVCLLFKGGKHSGCVKCVMDIMRGTQNIECPIDKARHTIRFEDIPNTRHIMDYLQSNSGANNPGYGGAPYPTAGGGPGFVPMPTLPAPHMPSNPAPNPPPYVGGGGGYSAPSNFGGNQPQFPGAGYNAPPSSGGNLYPTVPGGYNAPPARPNVPSYNNQGQGGAG